MNVILSEIEFSASGTVWLIVGVLLIVALLMFILGKRGV